jgi:hypothetical protein
MKISKELKHATFEWDEERKVFILHNHDGTEGAIELNKTYAFAFVRFLVRIAQRNWFRNKSVPNKVKSTEHLDDIEEHEHEDESQMAFL